MYVDYRGTEVGVAIIETFYTIQFINQSQVNRLRIFNRFF